jgi:hypothetical protein
MTIFAHGKLEKPSPSFYIGLLVAAAGMALVMVNKPKPAVEPKPLTNSAPAEASSASH